jgi:uncharacterized protein YkwD
VASPNALRSSRALTVLALCLLLFTAGLSAATSASAATNPELASSIVASVNSIRKAHDLVPLTVNPRLTLRADQHSALIASRKHPAELFTGEASLARRLAASGYDAASSAVTVAWRATQTGLLGLPAVFASPSHPSLRARLLNPAFRNVGIAVRTASEPSMYAVTVIYARPMTTVQVYATRVLTQLNAERAAHLLPALRMNGNLIRSAHAHNLAMARANEMSHQLPGEAFFATRISRTGYTYRTAGENIGYSTATALSGALQIQSTMYNETAGTDGHRRNILSGTYMDVGVDVVIDTAHHLLWLTQDFGSH